MKFSIKTTDALATQRLVRATNTAELPGMMAMGVGLTNNKVTPWRRDLATQLRYSGSQEITHLS